MEQLPGAQLILLVKEYRERRRTIKQVYQEQKQLHQTGENVFDEFP